VGSPQHLPLRDGSGEGVPWQSALERSGGGSGGRGRGFAERYVGLAKLPLRRMPNRQRNFTRINISELFCRKHIEENAHATVFFCVAILSGIHSSQSQGSSMSVGEGKPLQSERLRKGEAGSNDTLRSLECRDGRNADGNNRRESWVQYNPKTATTRVAMTAKA